MALNQTQTGPQQVSDGAMVIARAGRQGDSIISGLHGDYYESCYRKQQFIAAQQAVIATATIAGLSTTITGCILIANPPGSTVNLALQKFGVGFVLAPAASLAYGLAVGFSSTAVSGTLTSIAPRSAFVGGAQGQGQAYCSASMTLPVAATVAAVMGSASVTVVANSLSFFDLQGGIILPPGGYAHFWTSAVLAASAHIASISWEETPV